MSKKLFHKLIPRASTPVPKEQDKQLHPEGYSKKQTRPRKAKDTSAKQSDKSRQSNASSDPKTPR
jgi:hypothetical protein